jgi:signal transduction histidine kinase
LPSSSPDLLVASFRPTVGLTGAARIAAARDLSSAARAILGSLARLMRNGTNHASVKPVRSISAVAWDRLLAGGLGLAAQIELWVTHAWGDPTPITFAVAVAGTAPLLWRRRQPIAVVTIVLLAVVAGALADGSGTDGFSLAVAAMVAVFGAGAYAGSAPALGTAAVIIGGGWLWTYLDPNSDGMDVGDFLYVAFLVLVPLLAGAAVQRRRSRESELEDLVVRRERERDELAVAAVAEERARIARELHDVVAHAISVIVLQARGARHAESAERDDALDAIESTGATALAEMRRLLHMLRADDEDLALAPQPSLAHLELLVSQVRDAGLPVDLRVEGERRELPPGVDVSAYRIVQEALTNALKHAGPAEARVWIRFQPDALELEIADTGTGSSNGIGGHGLAGMRERVAVFGGELESGPRPGGGFTISARLPL